VIVNRCGHVLKRVLDIFSIFILSISISCFRNSMTLSVDESKPKGTLQKVSKISAIICFILMAISGYFLYIDYQELGMSDPITASWLATFFFFFFTGFSLNLLSKANIPSFKFDD
jgi:amino acid permease